jgi:putative transposase
MQDAFLTALEESRLKFDIQVFGYVVMPEHVHLLISEPRDNGLSKLVQVLKTKVAITARWTNRRPAGGTPFWQARYFDHNVRNHAGFVTQLRYIHRNPVKRLLCSAPQDWPWSSFRAWAFG